MDKPKDHTQFITLALASVAGLGYLPVSGTFGSLAGVGLYLLLIKSPFLLWLMLLIVTLISFPVSAQAEKILNKEDPSEVVIDEVVGQLIPLVLLHLTQPRFISGVSLFRIFDALKVPPANRLEALHGGLGIVLDDVMAGIYATISLLTLMRFFP